MASRLISAFRAVRQPAEAGAPTHRDLKDCSDRKGTMPRLGVFLSPLAHFGCTGHWSLSSRPTPHALRSLGPPSLPRAEPVPALPTRQEVNMLRHATFWHGSSGGDSSG